MGKAAMIMLKEKNNDNCVCVCMSVYIFYSNWTEMAAWDDINKSMEKNIG